MAEPVVPEEPIDAGSDALDNSDVKDATTDMSAQVIDRQAAQMKGANKAVDNANRIKVETSLQDWMEKVAKASGKLTPLEWDPSDPNSLQEALNADTPSAKAWKQTFENMKESVVGKAVKLSGAKDAASLAKDAKAVEKLQNELKSKGDPKSWSDVAMLVLKLAAAAGAAVGIYELLQKIADQDTGCYVYQQGKPGKGPLPGLSQDQCNCAVSNCSNLVAALQCPCQSTDCSAGALKCDYSNGGYEYYWQKKDFTDVLSMIPGALQQLGDAGGGFLEGLLGPLKNVLIGGAVLVGVVLLGWLVFHLVSSKKEGEGEGGGEMPPYPYEYPPRPPTTPPA